MRPRRLLPGSSEIPSALVADGVESVLDIFSGLLVWGGLRVSALPQSERYPYGLGKAEPLASLVVSTVLLLAAVGIAIGAVREILSPQEVPESFTLVVLVGVLIAKELMFRVLSARGREIGSQSLNADAWHHRSDALTSLAAFIGISVALTAGEGFESADDWAALVACAVITFNGVRLFRASLREVLDVTAPKEIRDRVREIAESVPGVDGVELLRVRQSGLTLWVDIHVEVEGEISVRAGHEIAHPGQGWAPSLGLADPRCVGTCGALPGPGHFWTDLMWGRHVGASLSSLFPRRNRNGPENRGFAPICGRPFWRCWP